MTCLRVFVSSKMGELDDERAIIKRALRARECEPILFEEMGARPESAQTAYLDGVRQSHVYVGIFWNAYSAATEEEYRLAHDELKIPCFVYVKESTRREPELERLLKEIGDPQRGVKYFPFRTVIELETQVQKDIQAWLTERALHPPQEFTPQQLQDALRTYLQWLIDANTYVFPRGIMQTARSVSLKLDDVFLSLRAEREVLTVDRRPMTEDEGRRLALSEAKGRRTEDEGRRTKDERWWAVSGRDEDVWLAEKWTRREFERTRIERVSLAQAIRDHARVIFLGEPGAGKTTLLRYLALLFARVWQDSELRVASGEFATPNSLFATLNASPPRVRDRDGNDYGAARLPIFFRIANYADAFAQQRNLSLREFLPDAFCDVNAPRAVLARLFDDALTSGRALVLLDGLDEIIDPGDRAGIATQIERFVAAYARQGNRFVVTSRSAGYRAAPLGGEFVHFTLAPMDESEIEKFLARWCPAVERAQTPDAPEAEIARRAKIEQDGILDAVEKHIGVRRLAENPLLLTILALIHRTGARLPSRRIELYQLAAKTLLEDWELARGIPSEHVVKEGEALRLLGPLALWLHENKPTGVASEDEVRLQLAQTLAAQRHAAPDDAAIQDAVDDFLRRVREHTGILVERAPRRYGFLHLTFEEYFCARELVRQPNQAAARIRAHLHEPRWNEPILLGIAYLSDAFPDFASDLIRTAILDAHSPYEDVLCRDLLFALQAMGDCASVDAQLCQNTVHQAVEIYLERDPRGRFEPLRDRILDVFANARGSQVTHQAVPLLLATLRDEDWRVRLRAAKALGRIGDVRVVDALLAALRDKDADVRWRAAEALGRIGDVRAVDALLIALRDTNMDVRRQATFALEKIGAPAVEPLVVALQDANADVRRRAAEALGQIGDLRAVKPLFTALQDKDADVRAHAAKALGVIGDVQAAAALLSALRDEDWRVRGNAAVALGEIGDGQVIQVINALLVALRDKNKLVRKCIEDALGKIGAPAVEPLVVALQDVNADVRGHVAGALGQIGDERAVKPLLAALQDENKWVRGRVVSALGAIGDECAVDVFFVALQDKNAGVRRRAAKALGKIGDKRAVDALLTALQDKDPGVRKYAAEALGRIGGARAVEALYAVMQDVDWNVRRCVIDALCEISDRRAVDALLAALRDERVDVRKRAAEALVKIGDARAVETLLAVLRDESANVRASGADALYRIFSARLQRIGSELQQKTIAALQPVLEDENYAFPREIGGRYYDRVCDVAWEALWAVVSQ